MPRNFKITSHADGHRQFNNGFRSNNKTSFKNTQGSKFNRNLSTEKIRKSLENEQNMDDASTNNQNFNNQRGKGRARKSLSKSSSFYLPVSKSNWYKVIITHAKELTKDFILKSLTSLSTCPFIPINFRHENNIAVFNVKNHNSAVAIKQCNKNITTPAGFKMIVSVSPTSEPASFITDDVLEKIKVVMSQRYDSNTSILNLSDFSNDPNLEAADIRVSFDKVKFVRGVLNIISQNIPQLKALDLSRNRVASLDLISSLGDKAPCLTSLNLSNNKISHENELKHLKKIKLLELRLEGNPFLNKFKDSQLYIRAMRQRFPAIIKLDDLNLPPPISFDIESTQLPETKSSQFWDDQSKDLSIDFFQKYFNVFDSSDRSPLIDAYHPSATFSLTCFQNRLCNSNAAPGFIDYLKYSRNLRRIEEEEKLTRVKRGRSEIIELLRKLPSTNHQPSSFVVDHNILTPSMMILTITGVFKQTALSGSAPIRHFTKFLVLVQHDNSMAIINEMLTIANLTPDLFQTYKKSIEAAAASSTQASSIAGPSSPSFSPDNLSPLQQQMMVSLSQKTGMNIKYSHMCLSGNDWNFGQAEAKYMELKANNSIPHEAFI